MNSMAGELIYHKYNYGNTVRHLEGGQEGGKEGGESGGGHIRAGEKLSDTLLCQHNEVTARQRLQEVQEEENGQVQCFFRWRHF
jgi:hypothetical protein